MRDLNQQFFGKLHCNPEFFGALKVAVTLAFIGTNLMEIVSPHGRGLGALFDSGKTNSDYPLMFAVLIALALLGIASIT